MAKEMEYVINMQYKFCPQCGTKLTVKEITDEGLIPFCQPCNKPYFMSAKVCVLIAIINEKDEVILSKQAHISNDKWILTSGYIKQGQTVEDAVIQETLEETGQEVKECIYISSYFHEPGNLLMLGFAALVSKKPFIDSSEISEIKWFSLKDAENHIWNGTIAEKHLTNTIQRLYSPRGTSANSPTYNNVDEIY